MSRPRPLLLIVASVALSSIVGCAGSSQQAVSHSLAAQVPTAQVAVQPPTDDEFVFVPKDNPSLHRFTKDSELAGSLHAASPTRTNE